MIIANVQYIEDLKGNKEGLKCTIDNVPCSVPLDPANRHYAEIMKQVEEGKLKIKDAE